MDFIIIIIIVVVIIIIIIIFIVTFVHVKYDAGCQALIPYLGCQRLALSDCSG
jgi:hypothetical protein